MVSKLKGLQKTHFETIIIYKNIRKRDKEYMKLISWNVNGLRACVEKGVMDFFNKAQADVFCIQESKLQEGQIELEMDGYYKFWNYAEKKGYSGTAIFTKIKPISVINGIGISDHDNEGRVITIEFEDYFLVNVYTPNAKRGLERLTYRMLWEDDFRQYLINLDAKKPVIVCGDLNNRWNKKRKTIYAYSWRR